MSGFSPVSLYSCHCKSFKAKNKGIFDDGDLQELLVTWSQKTVALVIGVILEEWLLTIELDVYVKLYDLLNENLQNATGCLVNNDMIPWSDDYDNSSYHFNDSKLASPSKS
ncbi:hypothetical protein CQW23_10268 [Capsicum baccatum]|uniref:Uncharacterized protein n=1 Tax=Capsicum baccatum TaxID=33114 RepID=A0A2G2WZA2_CAPBA|nr:hypothetical protein CQW23_10268 [Capsicum baccatum]